MQLLFIYVCKFLTFLFQCGNVDCNVYIIEIYTPQQTIQLSVNFSKYFSIRTPLAFGTPSPILRTPVCVLGFYS